MENGPGVPLTATGDPADDALRAVFPDGLPPHRRPSLPAGASAIVRTFPLERKHLEEWAAHIEKGTVLGVDYTTPLQSFSNTHHRIAQLLSMGMDPGRVAVICRVSREHISRLQSDPLFAEALAMYQDQVACEFTTVVQEMAALHEDVVVEIRNRLMENPKSVTIKELRELFVSLSDRVGHGPTSSHNVNSTTVSVTAEELQRIKNGSIPTLPDVRPLPVLTAEDRATIEGVFTVTTPDPSADNGAEGLGEGEGVRVREEGE